MFGITRNGKGLKASVYSPASKKVYLKLYEDGREQQLEMQEDPSFAGVFVCSFDKPKGRAGYCFENERGEFSDPYLKESFGRKQLSLKSRALSMESSESSLVLGNVSVNIRRPAPLIQSAPASGSIIYKLHVKGFTAHESSKVRHKGTFRGLKEKIPYIKELGVNAVLLMPCYEFNSGNEEPMGKDEKVNFWGYAARASYMAPKRTYAFEQDKACSEFSSMVSAFHEAGIAVYMEMDIEHGTSPSLLADILRFWAHEYLIDGFRLMGKVMLAGVASDPFLNGVRLICDNWDSESVELAGASQKDKLFTYGGPFTDNARRFLKGDEEQTHDMAENFRRVSQNVINYIADNNGFTLSDLYSYDERHNEVNGERGRDGREINYSWNCGVEGETGRKSIQKLRFKMIQNALTVLLLSRGTPLLMAGDEFLCSHKGNNNPYCCDNEYGYVIWNDSKKSKELTEYVRELIVFRRSHRAFFANTELRGMDYCGFGAPDISYHGTKAWYPDYGYFSRTLAIMLDGRYAQNRAGKPDDTFYIAFNMHWEEHSFDLPLAGEYEVVLDTDESVLSNGSRNVLVKPRSIVVLKLMRGNEEG